MPKRKCSAYRSPGAAKDPELRALIKKFDEQCRDKMPRFRSSTGHEGVPCVHCGASNEAQRRKGCLLERRERKRK